MRIGLVSSALHRCPPSGYGSEMTTWHLAEALCARGHEVVLFAIEGSRMPPRGVLATLTQFRPGDSGINLIRNESEPVGRYLDLIESVDVVHDMSLTFSTHEEVCATKFGSSINHKPHLCTLNGISYHAPHAPADHNVVVVSEASKKCGLEGIGAWENTPFVEFIEKNPAKLSREPKVVRYGTDCNLYRPDGKPDDYHLYIGRPHPAKGIDLILDLAQRMPDEHFKLAWRAELPDHQHFEKVYKSLAKDQGLKNVEFVELPVGRTHHEVKAKLLSKARSLIHPAVYVDACPSTVIEALACGTPVIATKHGGVPEQVIDGATGYLVDIPKEYWRTENIGGFLEAFETGIRSVDKFDRKEIRADAFQRHSKERMANEYLALYANLMKGETW